MLYANDYDLNANLEISSTVGVLHKVYLEFLQIFTKAYHDPEYYILDFKCGVYQGEPVRWSYDDMKKGYKMIHKHRLTFEECLLMDSDEGNIIKVDICYIHNNIFTDINCLYNFHMVKEKNSIEETKIKEANQITDSLRDDMKRLRKEGNLFKVIKRFSV
ncbi:MAG: hypothetical protein EOO06_17720 [Chitinophagaceae bacterium]|nr:MAG: hypothetical protein EOO06_17720 [Chitinophagaceae bacterium]